MQSAPDIAHARLVQIVVVVSTPTGGCYFWSLGQEDLPEIAREVTYIIYRVLYVRSKVHTGNHISIYQRVHCIQCITLVW